MRHFHGKGGTLFDKTVLLEMNLKFHCSVIFLLCMSIARTQVNAEETKVSEKAKVESASEIVRNHLPINIEWIEFDNSSAQGANNLGVSVVDAFGSFATTRCIYFRGWVKYRLLMDAIKKCSVVTQKFEPIEVPYPGQHDETAPLWWRQPGEAKTMLNDWWRRENRIVDFTLIASSPEGSTDVIMMLAGRLEYSAPPTNGNTPEKEWLGPNLKEPGQAGADQPATVPQLKSENKKDTNPESEGRSR